MSEHPRETEFLRQCLRYEDNAEHEALVERIGQLERDARCVRRAVALMAVLTALVVAGLGYLAVLGAKFPQDTLQLIVRSISALGLASVISLVAFAGLTMVYHMNLEQRREEGRQLVTKLLASRLGNPAAVPQHESPADGNHQLVPAAAGSDVTSQQTQTASTAPG